MNSLRTAVKDPVGVTYALLFTVLLAYGLYKNGLFFSPAKIYASVAVLAVLLVLGLIMVIRRKFVLPLWGKVALVYSCFCLFTTLWGAAPELAVEGSIVTMAAIALMVVAGHLGFVWRRVLADIIPITGVALYLFSMFTVFGWLHFTNAIELKMMDSVFQYHNTFAAYELSCATISLVLCITSSRLVSRIIYGIEAAICLSGVALSYSRLAWLLTILMLTAITVATSVLQKPLISSLSTGLVTITAIAALPLNVLVISHKNPLFLLLALIVVCGVTAVGTFFISYMTSIKSKGLTATMISITGAVVIGLIAVAFIFESSHLSGIINRIHSISFKDTSFTQRFWYYAAALKMWLGAPVFGSGFGTWTAKFQAYEQYPYWSTMTHSVLTEQLVDLGIVGVLLWVCLLGLILRNAIMTIRLREQTSRLSLAALLGAVALFIHATFDFDMNFPIVLFVFMVLLAVSTAPPKVPDEETVSSTYWGTYLTFASVVTVVVGAGLTASQVISSHSTSTKNPDQQIAALNRATKYAPYDPSERVQLANLSFNQYEVTGKKEYLNSSWANAQVAHSLAKWDPSAQQAMAQIAYWAGHLPEAYQWSQLSYKDGKFGMKYPESFMQLAFWSGVSEYSRNPMDAKRVFESVFQTYQQVKEDVGSFQKLPSNLPPEWAFKVDATMQVYAAAAEYCLGNYQHSMDDVRYLNKDGQTPDTMQLFRITFLLDQAKVAHQTVTNLPKDLAGQPDAIKSAYQAMANIG